MPDPKLKIRSKRNGVNVPDSVKTRTVVAAGKAALKIKPKPKPLYDCLKCPAYCCSYDRIDVSEYDIARLARHFEVSPEEAKRKFTKTVEGHAVLRHQKDHIFGKICTFIDPETRRCSVYEARPRVCRSYPEGRKCGYYDFLAFEREHQDDKEFIPYELG